MGLDRLRKTPCGFCFVEYYRRCDAENSVNFLSGTKLDERTIRVDYDVGFSDGRQYGRGRSGGQVRDEHRVDYDPGRGGFGRAKAPQTGMTGMQMWSGAPQPGPPMGAPGPGGRGRPYGDRGRRRGRGRVGGRGRGRPFHGPPGRWPPGHGPPGRGPPGHAPPGHVPPGHGPPGHGPPGHAPPAHAPPRYFGGMGQGPMKRRRESDEYGMHHPGEHEPRYKRMRGPDSTYGPPMMGIPPPGMMNPSMQNSIHGPPMVHMDGEMGAGIQRADEPMRNERFDRGRKDEDQ